MKRIAPAALLALSLLVPTAMTVGAQASYSANAQHALQWLQCTQQQPNGQIGSGGNPIARSSEVALGLAAAGQDPSSFKHGGLSIADYLKTAVSTDVGTNGILLMARALEPGTGSTATVIAQLKAAKSFSGPTAGEYGGDIFSDALAILGLHASGQQIDADSVQFLRSKQDADNGWSFDNGQSGSDSNTTALVLQAMVAAGVSTDDPAIIRGLEYLQSQFRNGGYVFSTQYGSAPDAQSDELVIGAIVATGRTGNQTWSTSLASAESNLASLQLSGGPDGGAVSGFDKVMASTPAAAAFLMQPMTATTSRATSLPLLACPTTAAGTAPTVPPVATRRLAATGQPIGGALLLLGLGLLTLGLLIGPRRRQRARRR